MEMTNEEIVRDFRLAKDQKESIRVLADLNLTTPDKIRSILDDAGVLQVKPRGHGGGRKLPEISAECRKALEDMLMRGEYKQTIMKTMGLTKRTVDLAAEEFGDAYRIARKNRMSEALRRNPPKKGKGWSDSMKQTTTEVVSNLDTQKTKRKQSRTHRWSPW